MSRSCAEPGRRFARRSPTSECELAALAACGWWWPVAEVGRELREPGRADMASLPPSPFPSPIKSKNVGRYMLQACFPMKRL